MSFDFETLSPARDHHFWNPLREKGIDDNAISYGVAEMKFPLCPAVRQALLDCAELGYFGYFGDEHYPLDVCNYFAKHHSWQPEPGWLVQTYGVVQAISIAIRSFTAPGDGVIIQPPVYTPFFSEIKDNNRVIIENPLKRCGERYEIDFADLEQKAASGQAKMLILCSPHNPVGRVWTRDELLRLNDICLHNNIIVVSDEIHNDLVFDAEHSVFASISPEAEQNCVVCTAPSKTYNIPGLVTSNIFVPNPELRERFKAQAEKSIGHFLNICGPAASKAAFEYGQDWLDELLQYLKENAELFRRLVHEKLPKAWTPKMEGTYLAWLDLSYLGMNDAKLEDFLIRKAGILCNMGNMYGDAGKGFIRINIGCPRRYVIDAVDRIAKAVSEIN